jgi:hypothetical protein
MLATTLPILGYFHITILLELLVWAALGGLSFLAWKKGKAQTFLLMLVGAGLLVLSSFLLLVTSIPSEFVAGWLPLFGAALILAGFYLSVKTMVAGDLAAMKEKMKQATKSGDGSGGGTGGAS